MPAAHDYGARYLYMVTAPPPPSLISLILGAWSKQAEYTGKIPFTFGRRVVVVVDYGTLKVPPPTAYGKIKKKLNFRTK